MASEPTSSTYIVYADVNGDGRKLLNDYARTHKTPKNVVIAYECRNFRFERDRISVSGAEAAVDIVVKKLKRFSHLHNSPGKITTTAFRSQQAYGVFDYL